MPKYTPESIVNLDPKSEHFKNVLIENLESIGEALNNLANENIQLGANIDWKKINFNGFPYVRNNMIFSGEGSPEGVVTAQVGSMYQRTDGGAGTSLYVKESGSGNTGWVGK